MSHSMFGKIVELADGYSFSHEVPIGTKMRAVICEAREGTNFLDIVIEFPKENEATTRTRRFTIRKMERNSVVTEAGQLEMFNVWGDCYGLYLSEE